MKEENEIISFLRAKTLFHIFVSPVPSTAPDTRWVGKKFSFNGQTIYKILNHTKQSASAHFPLNIISYLQR